MVALLDRASIETDAPLRVPQGGRLLFNFLLGATLSYLVINQQVNRPGPSPVLAEIEAAAQRSTDAERGSVMRGLESALASEPLDSGLLKMLTIYAKAAGDGARSDALAFTAARRSYRDVEAQTLALDISLRKQNYAEAMRILDAVLRTQTGSQEKLFPLLGTFAVNPRTLPTLVTALAGNPPWREPFLVDLARNGRDANVPFQLLAKLKGTASPPQANEVRALIARLLADGSHDRAYYVWLDNLPVQDLKKTGLVFDGGFEGSNRDLFFDWTFRKRKNIDARIISKRNSQADNALRIDFAKTASPFADVSQTLYLAPGNYRLEGEVKPENLQSEKGLLWKILCLNEPKQFLGSTARHKGTTDWSSFTADFIVPPNSCVMQRLVLVLDARSTLDRNISGRIWYDNLKIRSLDLNQVE